MITPAGGEGTGHWFFHQFITNAYDDDQGGFVGLDDFIWGVPQVGLISSRSACCVLMFHIREQSLIKISSSFTFQSLDWLDRTARKTAAQPIQSAASVEESYNVDDASLPSMSMPMFNGEDI